MGLLTLNKQKRERETPKKRPTPKTQVDHEAMIQADPYSFNMAHKRSLKLLRISSFLLVLSLFVNFMMAGAISILVPLKTTEVAFIKTDSFDNRTYRVEPITKDTTGFDLVMEATAKRYIRNVLTADNISHEARFEEAAKISDDNFFKKYTEKFNEIEKMPAKIRKGLNRSIFVENAIKVEEKNGVYRYAVDYLITDSWNGKTKPEDKDKPGRAWLLMTTQEQLVTEANKFENPLGIIVLDMIPKKERNPKKNPSPQRPNDTTQ